MKLDGDTGLLGIRLCRSEGLDPSRILRWQYVIQRGLSISDAERAAFTCREFAGWEVLVGRGLDIARVNDSHGQQVGLLLGFGVDATGRVRDGHNVPGLSAGASRREFNAAMISWLEELAGRYAFVFARPGDAPRLAVDPVNMIGAVYDPVTGAVGATLATALRRPIQWHWLFDPQAVRAGQQRAGLFQTVDAFARRLNPSCWLWLDSLIEERFWPGARPLELDPRSRFDAYAVWAENVERFIRALPGDRDIWFGLSGGEDCRVLAALGLGAVRERGIGTYTHAINKMTRFDARIAARLAAAMGLEHRTFMKFRHADAVDARAVSAFRAGGGFDRPVPHEVAWQVDAEIPDGAWIIRGHLVDMIRAHFYPRGGQPANDRWALRKSGMIADERRDAEAWRFWHFYWPWKRSLPKVARNLFLDFFFLESFFCSAWGERFPAISSKFYVVPFNCRKNLRLVLSLPMNLRRESRALNEIIEIYQPDLASVPFLYEIVRMGLKKRYLRPTRHRDIVAARRERTRERLPVDRVRSET